MIHHYPSLQHDPKGTEFQINQFLSLRLENQKTNIYIEGKRFGSCKYLLLNLHKDDIIEFSQIKSINEAMERYSNQHERDKTILSPETEFWGHCSNLQAWAEHNYNTNLLDTKLSFPLLKKLTEAGDPTAKRAFTEEIARRFEDGTEETRELLKLSYLHFLTPSELSALNIKNYILFNGKIKIILDNMLHLTNRGLTELSQIKRLYQIAPEGINLRNNKLTEIPKPKNKIKNIRTLWMTYNNLESIPSYISQFSSLKDLGVSHNELRTLPESLGKLKTLEKLSLSGNKLRTLPESIGELYSLKWLNLGNNSLRRLPTSFKNLENLRCLLLDMNPLTEIPDFLYSLPNIDTLRFYQNSGQCPYCRSRAYTEISPSRLLREIIRGKDTGIQDKIARCLRCGKKYINSVKKRYCEICGAEAPLEARTPGETVGEQCAICQRWICEQCIDYRRMEDLEWYNEYVCAVCSDQYDNQTLQSLL